jgi:site-specific DNA-cytosine methylase
LIAPHEFTAFFPFCGLGAGARGFVFGEGRLGRDRARFRNLGGIDNDPESCADFERLSGGPALCADLSKLTPAELLAWLELKHGRAIAHRRPDAVFLSPPCKGFSGLLSKKSAAKPKYQQLNELVFQGVFLILETWAEKPPLIILENVPRIATRGAELLRKVRQMLAGYGYVFHDSTHDCGEIGGLAQHRRRFLLVARHVTQVPGYVYRPPKQRVRGCGEVLGELPLPQDPSAGELHKLPKLTWLNWVRLALIPAGGDWRDLPGQVQPQQGNPGAHQNKFAVGDWNEPSRAVIGATRPGSGAPAVADPRLADAVGLRATADGAGSFKGRPGLFGVNDWEQPLPTVTGSATVSGSNAVAAVADPRVEPFGNVNRVTAWSEPVGTITHSPAPSSGAAAVADPRIPAELLSPLAPGQEKRAVWARYDVRAWDEPARTVAGPGVNGGFGVADPRPAREYRNGTMGVMGWSDPACTVTGESWPLNGRNSVADPRIGVTARENRFTNQYRVREWAKPAGCVTGDTDIQEGAQSVADPRLGCAPRSGSYGVLGWEEAAATITGNARIDNGRFAIADPRKPPGFIPVIIAEDGTWHRPLTTLELAALQGLPAQLEGKPLALAGKSVSRWRERIGNAVPVQAGQAIADTLLTALLAAALGTWTLGGTGIWVRDDGRTEMELEAELAEAA